MKFLISNRHPVSRYSHVVVAESFLKDLCKLYEIRVGKQIIRQSTAGINLGLQSIKSDIYEAAAN